MILPSEICDNLDRYPYIQYSLLEHHGLRHKEAAA